MRGAVCGAMPSSATRCAWPRDVVCAPAMPADSWNHVNFCVPPEHLDRLCAAIEALFPWETIVRKPGLVGYRLGEDLHRAALYLRPSPAAADVAEALGRLAVEDAALATALTDLGDVDPDVRDHFGVRIATVEEWERRVAVATALERTRPDLAFEVVRVIRPSDPGAPTTYLYQAWVRLHLLGPLRNTIELQTGA